MDANSRQSFIEVDHVFQTYKTALGLLKVLEDISFSICSEECVALLGPSGCGKSTLLNIVAGMKSPDRGRVIFHGGSLKQPERHRMMIFQEAALFPWYSVIQNVMYGLRFKAGLLRRECREIAMFYLSLVNLQAYADARVYQLSGGMKQRVALARALAPNPKLLLMDEPFSALDIGTCESLYKDVQRIWQTQKKTLLFVTHNIREAVVLAQRIFIFSPCPGRIIKEVRIDLPYPRNMHDPQISTSVNEIEQILHTQQEKL